MVTVSFELDDDTAEKMQTILAIKHGLISDTPISVLSDIELRLAFEDIVKKVFIDN